MRAQDQDVSVGIAFEKLLTRGDRTSDVEIKRAARPRLGQLYRMVHEIAGNDGFLAARRNMDTDVSRRMPRCRLEEDFLAKRMVCLHELVKSRINDGPQGILKYGARFEHTLSDLRRHVAVSLLIVLLRPMLPLFAAEKILRVRECRHPSPVDQFRIPPNVVDVEMRAKNGVNGIG